jgi:hypothetical protein
MRYDPLDHQPSDQFLDYPRMIQAITTIPRNQKIDITGIRSTSTIRSHYLNIYLWVDGDRFGVN